MKERENHHYMRLPPKSQRSVAILRKIAELESKIKTLEDKIKEIEKEEDVEKTVEEGWRALGFDEEESIIKLYSDGGKKLVHGDIISPEANKMYIWYVSKVIAETPFRYDYLIAPLEDFLYVEEYFNSGRWFKCTEKFEKEKKE